MLFRPMGDVEDDLAGDDSSALASYGPTAVTTPSSTSSPYFGPDINPSSGTYTPTASSGGSSWFLDLGKSFTSALGTGVGAAIQNIFRKPSAPAAPPQTSSNMLMTVGIVGVAVVGAALLLRRRA